MKNLTKKITCSIMTAVLILCIIYSAVAAVIPALTEADTPVADIPNDTYVPYMNRDRYSDALTAGLQYTANSVGGKLKSYKNEEEYYNAQNTPVRGFDINTVNTANTVRMTLQVLDKLTNKPIANAITRLNGVPRYTNREGIVNVKLNQPIYELFIIKNCVGESENYNPYMEFIYLEDFDKSAVNKTVYMSRPSDDLEVTSVNLRIGSASSEQPEYYNLLEQEYHFAHNYMDYPADIIVETNIAPDYCMLYVNGELERTTVGNDFIFFDYNKTNDDGTPYYNKYDKFSIKFVYNGIESKNYDLLLYFENLEDIQLPNIDSGANGEFSGGFNEDQDNGLFGELTIDVTQIAEVINDLLKQSKKGAFRPLMRRPNSSEGELGPVISAVYNPRDNTLTFLLGLEFKKQKVQETTQLNKIREYEDAAKKMRYFGNERKKTQKALKEKQDYIQELERSKKDTVNDVVNTNAKIAREKKEYEDMTKAYLSSERLNGEGMYEQRVRNGDKNFSNAFKENAKKLASLKDEIIRENGLKNALLSRLKDLRALSSGTIGNHTGVVSGKMNFGLRLQLLGRWQLDLTSGSIKECKITGEITVNLSYNAQFMVIHIPVYARVEVSGSLRAELYAVKEGKQLSIQDFIYQILFIINISFRGDVGIGLYDVASIGGLAKAGFKAQIKIGDIIENDLKETYGKFYARIGFRIKVLFFEYEYIYPKDGEGMEWYIFGDEKADKQKLLSRTFAESAAADTSGALIEGCYQDASAQIVNLSNGDSLMTWLSDNPDRDGLNRTALEYAVCHDGIWSNPKAVTEDTGMADLYPELYQSGDNTYITWQRANRRYIGNDDISSMSSAGEVWVSRYDEVTGEFVRAERITDNSEMDLAPKFVLQEKTDDPLAIVWQKNSENDLFGIQGKNTIVSSSLINGKWTSPREEYASNNIITHVSAAYKNGKINLAFIEDADKDPMTALDREVKVIGDGKLLYSDAENVANTQFTKLNGKIGLFYYSNGSIIFTEDYEHAEIIVSSEDDEFALGFRVASNQHGTVIFYDKTDGEFKQSYCVSYDSSTDTWTKGVRISEPSGDTDASIGYIDNRGDLVYIYKVSNEAEDYAAICYGVKNFKYGVEILDASFLDSIRNGQNAIIAVSVMNVGDYEIDKLTIEIFGQVKEFAPEAPLQVGDKKCFVIDCLAVTSGEVSAEIKVTVVKDGIAAAEAKYSMYFGYADYQVDAALSYDSRYSAVNLTIYANSDFYSSAIVNIYVNGEMAETIEIENLCADGKPYEMTYALKNVKKGDYVYIEAISESLEINKSDNACGFIIMRDSVVEKPVIINPYVKALEFAKAITGGIAA